MLNPHRYRTLAVLWVTFGLSGCSGLLDSNEPAASQWWLEPPPLATERPLSFGALALDLTVVPGLDTDRILNLDDRARLNHYAGAFWTDHLPEVLDSLLIRSFEAGNAMAARSAERAANGECLLKLEATAFYGRIDRDGITQRVEVAFSGSLNCDGQRRDLRTSSSERVGENRMSAIVAAFQSALNRSVDELAAQMSDG